MIEYVISQLPGLIAGLCGGGAIVWMYRSYIERNIKPHIDKAVDEIKEQL